MFWILPHHEYKHQKYFIIISYSTSRTRKPFKNYYRALRKSGLHILKCTGRKRIYDKQTNQPWIKKNLTSWNFFNKKHTLKQRTNVQIPSQLWWLVIRDMTTNTTPALCNLGQPNWAVEIILFGVQLVIFISSVM